MQAVRICQLADLEQNKPRCYRVENVDVLVVRREDRVYAVQNRCGHAGAPLHRGEFTDDLIVCPLHGAAFHIDTGAIEWAAIIPPPMSSYINSDNPRLRMFGELLNAIETLPIKTFSVTLKDRDIYVTVQPVA